MEDKKSVRKFNKKKILIILGISSLFVILIIYILAINISARALEKYTEVTFVSPNQAIVFWKSEKPTLGFIKYGEKKLQRKNIELQTSSEKSEIHVVFIDRVPPEGLYISKHLENSNIFVFPKIEHIQYNDIDQNNEQ